ncbi:CynX/NimT family MFS transporter [Virgibacillus proomii]|uniref:CynX/NimT family MFS transporter n=1 Tax=Virgibacillus proomii TaxID=84407 RepID=UPI001C100787|nr:MFS transporter [Virgibacillus proomii]MBU5267141.1 MFS transporter [Virgibacillus proomii]
METKEETEQKKVFYRVIIATGIIVVAFNLRPSITSVGPLIGTIRDHLGLSNWSAGMLTSLPLIAFAVMSPLVTKLSNRFTNERVMLLGLFGLFIGITLRSMAIISLLFVGTLLIGLGIAICNVLLPSVIKEKFPMKVALMTSIYSTAMGISAATASGLSVPIAEGLHFGWQIALIVWAIPALLGIIVWIYLRKQLTDHYRVLYQPIIEQKQIWRSPLAWQVAAFMGFQSFLFYVTISWMPEILQAYGISASAAGWMLSFLQFIGLPASFIVPVLAGQYRSQHGIVLAMGLFSIIGYTGLLLGKSNIVMVVSIILIGFSLSGTFALALTLLGMRARNGKQAAQLSGMAQSVGYVLAAIGPFLVGYLYDKTQTWDIPLLTLISVAIIVVVFGFGAGRDKYVFDE